MSDGVVCIQCGNADVRLISEYPRIYTCRCGCYWRDESGIMIPVKRLSVWEAKNKLKELDILIGALREEGLLEDPLEPYVEAIRRFKTGIIHGL